MGKENMFSCIVKNTDGVIIDAFNIVAGSFSAVEEMAKKKEDETGNEYIIQRDETLFDVIQILQAKYIQLISELIDVRDNIDSLIRGDDD